jgi:hypothetical protein
VPRRRGPPDRSRPRRRYGPDVDEPPLLVDPRRWGSLVGVAGGLLFVLGCSSGLGGTVSAVVRVLAVGLALAVLHAVYVRPVGLGPLVRPRPVALLTYGACVVGELLLIALGTRALVAAGSEDLRPALIATVVGLHFLPFSWAFGERVFLVLGGVLVLLGTAGLLAGALGAAHAAEASAVAGGLAMLLLLRQYARGRCGPAS